MPDGNRRNTCKGYRVKKEKGKGQDLSNTGQAGQNPETGQREEAAAGAGRGRGGSALRREDELRKGKAPRIAKESLERLIKIQKQIKEDRAELDRMWREAARYINPGTDWSEEPSAAQKAEDTRHIYDTTAVKASNTLADGIQGYSFARNQAWFKLGLEEINDLSGEESAWLSYAEREMYAQLQKSNFYDEGRTFVKCGADFGTAIMTREDDVLRRMPVYRAQHLKNCCIDGNRYGEADTLFIDFWRDAYKAAEIFGEDRLPAAIREARGHENMKLWKFTQAVLPADKYGLDIEHPAYKRFYTVFWADIEKDRPLLDGYYQLKPFFVWRWARNLDGGVWGAESPGLDMLPDIKQLNGMRADYSRMVQQMGRPPIKATEGLNGRINLKPNGVTEVRPGEDFALMQAVGNPSGIIQDMDMIRRSVNEAYYTDFFLILTQNIERQKTATEVSGIQGEKAALMSAFYGRLASEFLEPVLEDLFSLELLSGRIGRPPDSLLEKGGGSMRIDMISPLAQMQKRYLMLGSSRQAVMEIAALAQINPSVLDNLNLDREVRDIAEAYGLDKRVLYEEEEVAEVRRARARAEARQMESAQKLQAMDIGGKALANASKASPELLDKAGLGGPG